MDRAVRIHGVLRQSVDVTHAALYHTRDIGPHGRAEGLDHWLGSEFADAR